MHFTLKDHQGRLKATVSGNTVEQELGYDAWGNLRDPETWCVDADIKPMFDRGYTGHEHLTAFGLVNMNGRMYDPVMSSFLSVDRYVQQPDNSQGFNRYAYCMYNPLRYVDPTGWVMSRPNGIGTNPPNGRNGGTAKVDSVPVPTSSDTMGECAWFLLLRDVVITDYATPSSGGPSSDHLPEWSSERGWGNYGSIEGTLYYDEMEPCFGSGGGMGYYGIDYKRKNGIDYVMPIASYGNSTVGTLLSCNAEFYNKRATTEEIKQLGAKLRPKLRKLDSPLGKKSTMKIGKEVGKNLKIANKAVGIGSVMMEMAEIFIAGEIKASNVFDVGIATACIIATGPAGWIIGGTYLFADIVSYAYSGRSLGGNLDHYVFDDMVIRIW